MPAANTDDSAGAGGRAASGGGGGTFGFFPPNTEAGPLGPPQDLSDLAQGINAWGPVTDSYEVEVRPGVYETLNRLSSVDPFTASWQLEDGTLVTSNEPLDIIATRAYATEYDLPTTTWTGPDDVELNIYVGRIMVWYKPEVTETQLWTEIAAHNLHVVMSWFEPSDDPELGNSIAWFDFEYDQEEFETFQDAFAHFSADQKVDWAIPSVVDAFVGDYAPPDDDLYQDDLCQHVNILGADSLSQISYGPECGGTFSNQVVIVIDDGVWRGHDDFYYIGGKKLANNGVNIWSSTYEVGIGFGEPIFRKPTGQLVDHGTQMAGLICACTDNPPYGGGDPIGIASLAPCARVLPVRLHITGVNEVGLGISSYSSLVKAIRALRFRFATGQWSNSLRVANISRSSKPVSFVFSQEEGLLYNIARDVLCNQRFYAACAGNEATAKKVIPAAFTTCVLGVSGVWYDFDDANDRWKAAIGGKGSNFYGDGLTTYPISGVFDFNCPPPPATQIGSFSLSIARENNLDTSSYNWANGTSAATAQISALAFHLFTIRPSATVNQVKQKIINSRRSAEGNIAGCVQYDQAFSGW